jgi:hypothetical protein
MSEPWTYIAAVYVAGVLWGLFVIDARAGVRIGLAVLWPLGPLAFVLTVTLLLAASLIAFPLWGATVVALAAIVLFALRF